MIELVASPQQLKFGQDKRDTLPRECLECDVRFRLSRRVPEEPLHCDAGRRIRTELPVRGFKAFFHHVDFRMKLMAGLFRRGHEGARGDGGYGAGLHRRRA